MEIYEMFSELGHNKKKIRVLIFSRIWFSCVSFCFLTLSHSVCPTSALTPTPIPVCRNESEWKKAFKIKQTTRFSPKLRLNTFSSHASRKHARIPLRSEYVKMVLQHRSLDLWAWRELTALDITNDWHNERIWTELYVTIKRKAPPPNIRPRLIGLRKQI